MMRDVAMQLLLEKWSSLIVAVLWKDTGLTELSWEKTAKQNKANRSCHWNEWIPPSYIKDVE